MMAVKNYVSLSLFILSVSIALINADFYAQYYNSESGSEKTFTKCFRQQVTSRVDSNINFKYDANWNVLPSQLATKKNDFAVRWSGWLVPQDTGKYEFGVRGDDGYVLTLDETVLFSEWKPQATVTKWSAPQALIAGMKYKLRLEYYQAGGGAEIALLWKVNGGHEQQIPTQNVKPLTPAEEKTTVINSNGWQTNFYRSKSTNTDMSPDARFLAFQADRIDSDVNYPNWDRSWSSRGIQGPTEYFSTRWTGLVTPPADGTYNLFMNADDGVRVLVNGRPLIAGQSWNQVQTVKEYHASTVFRANTQYQITVEYFQMQGGAYSQLMWSSASLAKSVVASKFVQPVRTTTSLNVVPFSGRRFAVLDGTDATITKSNKQAEFKAIPPGWKIAKDCSRTRLVAALGKWGADGVVVDDGKVLRTGAVGELRGPSATNLESFDMDNTKVFRPDINTNNRILIESDKLSPGDVDIAVPTIKSTVVFGRRRFAALDATNPAAKPGQRDTTNSRYGNTFHKVPAGWKLATPDAQTKVIMMGRKYSFGAKEVVTQDGVAFDVNNGKPKENNQMETVNTEDGEFMRPKKPEQAILITQDAQNQPDSWQVVRTITNVARVRSGNMVYFYATLDNTRADESRQECQDVPLGLPTGWSLASRNADFENQVIRQNAYQFGARCLVFADGTGMYTVNGGGNCGTDLLAKSNFDNRDLFAPSDCSVERRILIQRIVPMDQLPANEMCGKCLFWGDPHVETFAGASWTFALSKTASYTFLKPKANLEQNFKIWTTNQPYKNVDSISDVYIQYNSETLRFNTIQQGPQAFQVTRNGRNINPDADHDPSAVLVPIKITNNLNGEWTMWSVTLPNGILMWVGLQRWENINLWTVYTWVPNSLRGATEGICGACGDDNMYWSNGRSINRNANANDLNQYAGSWITTGGISASFNKRQNALDTPTTNVHSNNTCTNKYMKAVGLSLCKSISGINREHCLVDYCASGSYASVKSALTAATAARTDVFQDATCNNNSFIPITNFVNFQGYDFAVLDNIANNTKMSGGQTNPIAIPPGWEIAPDTPLSRAFIACSSFGATCLTLRSGLALTRDLKACHKGITNLRYTNGGCVSPVSTARILLVRTLSFNFISQVAKRFEKDGPLAKAWNKLGNGYALINGTDLPGMTVRLTAQTGQMAGAQFQGADGNNQPFTVGVWSRVTRAFVQTATSVYGMRIELSYDGTNFTTAGFVPFNATILTFNYRHTEIIPTGTVKIVRLTLEVSGFEDIEADFASVAVYGSAGHAGNLLKNPTVYNNKHWSVSKGGGFDISYAVDHTGSDASGSIQISALTAATKGKDFLASQVIKLTDAQRKNVRGIYFSGWSMQKGASGSPASGYSIFVNLVFTDGSKTTGVIAPFSEYQRDWQMAERVYRVATNKQIQEIQFAVVFRRHAGLVYFDDLYLTLLPCAEGTESIDLVSGAVGLGHIVTLSGRIMDLPAPGDWIIFQDQYMTVTGRYVPQGTSALALTSVAIRYGPNIVVQVDRSTDSNLPVVQYNKASMTLSPGNAIELGEKNKPGTGSIVLGDSFEDQDGSASVFIDFTQFGHRVVVTASVGDNGNQWLQVFPKPPLNTLATASGLMGKYDPVNSKNLIDAFDNVQPASYTADVLDVEKWKATVDSNILDSNDAKPSPDAKITRREISSYPSELRAAANDACLGVALRESCQEDYLSSEGDRGMAYSYGTLEQLVTSAEPSEFVSNLTVQNDDDDDVSFDQKTFIIVCAAVGAAVVVVIAILVALLIKSKSQRQYAVLNS